MQKNKLPNMVTLLILTMITTVMWVGFSIYRAFTQVSPPSVPSEISATLNPSLDTDSINKIESALFFSESQVPTFSTIAPSGTPTPIPTLAPIQTPIPTESPSATPEVSPAASPTP